jgi:hypothetical protein
LNPACAPAAFRLRVPGRPALCSPAAGTGARMAAMILIDHVNQRRSTAAALESMPLWSCVRFVGLPKALAGVYYRTNEKRFEWPIYHKADGSDRWIEFDAKTSTWNIKRGVDKGTFFSDAYYSCYHGVPLETCTSDLWHLTGTPFHFQPGFRLWPLASCDSKFSFGQLVRIEGLKQASFPANGWLDFKLWQHHATRDILIPSPRFGRTLTAMDALAQFKDPPMIVADTQSS